VLSSLKVDDVCDEIRRVLKMFVIIYFCELFSIIPLSEVRIRKRI
jgi:hypothetical protein